MGNIVSKTDAGSFLYNLPGKPYAIGQQTLPGLQAMQARYIRDVINGNNINTGNHWAEIQAIHVSGSNVALGKTPSGTSTITNPALITDGSTISDPYAYTSGSGAQTITLDLGQTQNLSDIKVWHYYKDWRTYNGSKTEISTNGTNWTALYDASQNGTYKETPLGRKYGPNPDRPAGTNTITYTSSEKPLTIVNNGLTASFTYNIFGERGFMNLTYANANAHNIYYLGGNYEQETRNTIVTERLYLGGSAYSAPAVAIRTGSEAWKIYYIHRDYLGSICAITNTPNGNDPVVAIEKRSYDAWGRLRKPTTLQPYGPGEQPALFLNRGYTGHEHLPEFGLINCNARLYDPIIGRFLSPDPFVQAPEFSQSYNRYSYCLNNPLIYTDPDGEFVFTWLAATFCPVLIPVGIFIDFFTDFGYEVQKSVSPVAVKVDLKTGSNQGGIGLDVSVGVPQMYPVSYRVHGGATYYWKNKDMLGNDMRGWETRYGSEWAFSIGDAFVYSYSGTTYNSNWSGKQTVNMHRFSYGFLNARYKNDAVPGFPFKYLPLVPKGDGDRYRTAAAEINYGPFGFGMYLITGDAGYELRNNYLDPDGKYYMANNGYDPNSHRMGVFYGKVGPIRVGGNSEGIRHVFQNRFAHDFMTGGDTKWFEVLSLKKRWWWQFGGSPW